MESFQNQCGTDPSLTIGPVKQIFERKNAIIFLPSKLYICFGCSKEPSH